MEDKLENMTCIPLESILATRARIANFIDKTPLVPLNVDIQGKKVYLKLENLQAIHSFKIRGASGAITNLQPEQLKNGVFTASAGNFGQGVAMAAKQMGVPCKVVVPDNIPQIKFDRMQRLGAVIHKVPYERWWDVMSTHAYPGMSGVFLHPVCQKEVIAGNASMGLEILEDLPDVDTIISPFGGGGCLCGIASAMKGLKPDVNIIAVEVETSAPLAISLKAGKPLQVENAKRSFVDGMGGKSVFPEMWNMVSSLVKDSIVLSVREIAEAVKVLLEGNCVVAEGAGAAPVAAVLNHLERIPGKKIVCIVSGGNIDTQTLVQCLNAEL